LAIVVAPFAVCVGFPRLSRSEEASDDVDFTTLGATTAEEEDVAVETFEDAVETLEELKTLVVGEGRVEVLVPTPRPVGLDEMDGGIIDTTDVTAEFTAGGAVISVDNVVPDICNGAGAAMLFIGNDPGPQRQMQSHAPFDKRVPVPVAIPPGDPTASVDIETGNF
jgi:hypothetical protein